MPYQEPSGWLDGALGPQTSSAKIIRQNGSETVDLGIKGRRAIVCASSKGLGTGLRDGAGQ